MHSTLRRNTNDLPVKGHKVANLDPAKNQLAELRVLHGVEDSIAASHAEIACSNPSRSLKKIYFLIFYLFKMKIFASLLNNDAQWTKNEKKCNKCKYHLFNPSKEKLTI